MSSNRDYPESVLDALMQAAVCTEVISILWLHGYYEYCNNR